jgi:hypothetical protein
LAARERIADALNFMPFRRSYQRFRTIQAVLTNIRRAASTNGHERVHVEKAAIPASLRAPDPWRERCRSG